MEGLNEGILLQDTNDVLISASQRTADIFDPTLQRLYALTVMQEARDNYWTIQEDSGQKVQPEVLVKRPACLNRFCIFIINPCNDGEIIHENIEQVIPFL